MVPGTLTRLPWIETEVGVWVLDGAHLQQIRSLARIEVFERLRELPPRISSKAKLTLDQERWLEGIDTSGWNHTIVVTDPGTITVSRFSRSSAPDRG